MDAGHETDRDEGVPAEVEEVVVGSDLGDAEQFAPHGGERLDHRRGLWGCVTDGRIDIRIGVSQRVEVDARRDEPRLAGGQ